MSSGHPFLLFTDAPPLREGGYGCNVLSRNLLEDLGELFGLVITRRLDDHVRQADLWQAPGTPVLVFPDAPWFRPRRLRPWIDLLLFLVSLPRLAAAARRSGCRRIFALFGADPWFLLQVDLLRSATGLPLDVYLVDDLETSSQLSRKKWQARSVRRVEPRVLRRAARVFVISPGYAEHLAHKYAQPARWLPLPARTEGVEHRVYHPGVPDRRAIVFVGSINDLYLDGLCRLYEETSRWNRFPGRPYELRLRVLTRREPRPLLDRLPHRDFLDLALDLGTSALHDELHAAWAVFLPYSFDPALRTAVATSFSHKFTESAVAGRPILVYGPPDASLPRHFRTGGLPLCVTDPDGLRQGLEEIAACDGPGLIARYGELLRTFHSPENLRAILAEPTSSRRVASRPYGG